MTLVPVQTLLGESLALFTKTHEMSSNSMLHYYLIISLSELEFKSEHTTLGDKA